MCRSTVQIRQMGNYTFLNSGGEVGENIRNYDWSSNPLGEPSTWAESLKTLTSVMLSSKFPMVIWWGDELIQLYNDAYKPNMVYQGKYPGGIGQPARECWEEVWSHIHPLIQEVKTTGKAVWREDLPIPIIRNGVTEIVNWTFCYSPIHSETGHLEGIFVVCTETTPQVQLIDQLRQSEAKFRKLIEQAPVASCLLSGTDLTIEMANDRMKHYFPSKDILGKSILEVLSLSEESGSPGWLQDIYESGKTVEQAAVPVSDSGNVDAETRYFDVSFTPLFDTDQRSYGVIAMAVDVTDRVRTEKRTQEIQNEVYQFFEQSPVGIAILTGSDMVFSMVNTFYCELVGRSSGELLHKSLFEALPELRGQGFDQLLLEVMKSGIPYVANEVGVNLVRGGVLETLYVDLVYQPRKDDQGEVSGVFVVATDVTLQVRSRRKVEKSQRQLKSLINAAPVGIGLFLGRELIIDSPNQTFIDMVGKGWEVVGKPLVEAMPELITEGQPFLKILDDVFTSGITFQTPGAQVKIVQNGIMTYNYYNITYKPLFDETGAVYAILDVAVDVTETVLATRKAEETEASLTDAVELAELAMWRLDFPDRKMWLSPRFKAWLEVSGEFLDMETIFAYLSPENQVRFRSKLDQAATRNDPSVFEEELSLVNPQSRVEHIVHVVARISFDEDGNPAYLSGTAQDITGERRLQGELEKLIEERTGKLVQANADLKRSNDELEKFAYIASHDLQEPVRKISTFIKMLDSRLEIKDEKSRHYIDRIAAASDRMGSLIRDLLGFSRLSGKKEAFERVDLEEVFLTVASDFELVLEQKGGTITHDLLPAIEAVSLQMEQLFHNLISNALKYARAGVSPVLNITVSGVDAEEILTHRLDPGLVFVKMVFSDNGIGFSPQYAEQIFEIFQRLHGKTEYAGTGIGLAMCRKIAQNHKGTIYATSQGSGATFTVILPVFQ